MATWEYKRGINLNQDQMDVLGQQGWELVNVIKSDVELQESDAKGEGFPPYVTPGTPVSDAIVSYWKRPVP